MFDIKETAKELDRLLHDIVVKQGIFVPINRDLIRYKNYMMVRNEDNDWVVLLAKDKKIHIATVCLKVSAFAMCKLHEKRRSNSMSEVDNLDKHFKKNYIDSLFYKKTAQTSSNEITRDNAVWRYEIASSAARDAKKKIDDIFYASLV
jgi:hypothetical protein